jgi:hypothetical protein
MWISPLYWMKPSFLNLFMKKLTPGPRRANHLRQHLDAGDAEEGEVRTHEVPQDDVHGEYRDKEE